MEHIELDGEPTRLASNFVAGLENLSIRYRLAARRPANAQTAPDPA